MIYRDNQLSIADQVCQVYSESDYLNLTYFRCQCFATSASCSFDEELNARMILCDKCASVLTKNIPIHFIARK